MTPLDLGLAASGRLAAAVERRVGTLGTWAIVLGLVLVSGAWVYLIGSSPRPTDVSFDDIRSDRIPAMTSWVRVEGAIWMRRAGGVEAVREKFYTAAFDGGRNKRTASVTPSHA